MLARAELSSLLLSSDCVTASLSEYTPASAIKYVSAFANGRFLANENKRRRKTDKRISLGTQKNENSGASCALNAKSGIGDFMSDLIVVTYPDLYKAGEVVAVLQRLQRQYLLEMEDAAFVTKEESGKVKLHQTVPLTRLGAISGAATGTFWGAWVGLLFLNPLLGAAAGMAVGGASGAIGGALSDYGISDDFIKSLGHDLQPGTSAAFVLIRKATTDKVLAEVAKYGGHVLRSSLSSEQEARLQAALAAGTASAAGASSSAGAP